MSLRYEPSSKTLHISGKKLKPQTSNLKPQAPASGWGDGGVDLAVSHVGAVRHCRQVVRERECAHERQRGREGGRERESERGRGKGGEMDKCPGDRDSFSRGGHSSLWQVVRETEREREREREEGRENGREITAVGTKAVSHVGGVFHCRPVVRERAREAEREGGREIEAERERQTERERARAAVPLLAIPGPFPLQIDELFTFPLQRQPIRQLWSGMHPKPSISISGPATLEIQPPPLNPQGESSSSTIYLSEST